MRFTAQCLGKGRTGNPPYRPFARLRREGGCCHQRRPTSPVLPLLRPYLPGWPLQTRPLRPVPYGAMSTPSRQPSSQTTISIISSQRNKPGKKGADDALLLNTAGAMACTTIGNLFAIFGKTLKTPPISDGVLPGIMRAKILQFAQLWGFDAAEETLSPEDIKKG